MAIVPVDKLYEEQPHAEIDDFLIAIEMAKELVGLVPDLRIAVLAKWAARLRERYVEVGRSPGPLSVTETTANAKTV